MLPKRKTAIRKSLLNSSQIAPTDIYEGYKPSDLLEKNEFKNTLYMTSLQTVANRIDNRMNGRNQTQLNHFIQRLFGASDIEHKVAIDQLRDLKLAEECRLKVTVIRAENLAGKDVDGTSDPYCVLSVARNTNYEPFTKSGFRSSYPVKTTSIQQSNLNPEWNESFEFRINRSDIASCALQVQIWDLDAGDEKKVKGFQGVRRFMKEKMTLSDEDDHMGFASIPLSSIPVEGLDKWTRLKSISKLETVTGRIKIRVEVVVTQNVKNEVADIQFASLLQLCIDKSLEKLPSNVSEWDGLLESDSYSLLQEFMNQHRMDPLTGAVIKWEVYMDSHLAGHFELPSLFIFNLLSELEKTSSDSNQVRTKLQHQASRYRPEILKESTNTFLKKSYLQIANHREIFLVKQKDYIFRLGYLLKCFKKILTMNLFNSPNSSANLSVDIIDDIIISLEEGTEKYYTNLYKDNHQEVLEADLEEENPPQSSDLQEISQLVKFCQQLYNEMNVDGQRFKEVFKTYLDINYFSTVYEVASSKLCVDVNNMMTKAKNILATEDLMDVKEFESYNSSVFNLYMMVKQFSSLGSNIPSSNQQIRELEDKSVKFVKLVDFHEMFRPALLRWLQLSHRKTKTQLKKAVDVDKMSRIDEIVKHSSSAVDTTSCLSAHVLDFWSRLQWPDPVDTYTISFRIIDDVINSAEYYAKQVHGKLNSVGFFDLEGQFDVTEELCIALNNLQHVKAFGDDLPRRMDIKTMAEAVDSTDIGCTASEVIEKVHALINSSMVGLRKAVNIVTDKVGEKMRPDILRYCREFSKTITEKNRKKDFTKSFENKEARLIASQAVKPLMIYLQENIINLHNWLCKANFVRVLECLWIESLRALKKVSVVDSVEEKPMFFKQCRYVMSQQFMDFFFADGAGISLERMMKMDEYQMLNIELKLRSIKTVNLIRLFYCKMHQDQEKMKKNPIFGILEVSAFYNQTKEELEISILRAQNLLALDLNGSSDPFVRIKLVPEALFPNENKLKTAVQKKSLNPIFDDEPFKISVPLKHCLLEGSMIQFCVYDHDIFGKNDLEGETFLPLCSLQGVATAEIRDKASTIYQLPLSNYVKPDKSTRKKVRQQNLIDQMTSLKSGVNEDRYAFNEYDDSEDSFESFGRPLEINPLMLIESRQDYDDIVTDFLDERKDLENSIDHDKVFEAIEGNKF